MNILLLPDDCLSLVFEQCTPVIMRQVCTQFWHLMNHIVTEVHLHSGARVWDSLPFAQARQLKCGEVDVDMLKVICRDCPGLESLVTYSVAPESVSSAVTHCRYLHVKNPAKHTQASRFHAAALRAFPQLRVLIVDNAAIPNGPEDSYLSLLQQIAACCPLLEICKIKTDSPLTETHLSEFFHSLPQLQVLKLTCTWVRDPIGEHFLAAAACPKLRVLRFHCPLIQGPLDMTSILGTLMERCPDLVECVIPWVGYLRVPTPSPLNWMRLRRIHLNQLPNPEHFPNLTHICLSNNVSVYLDDIVPFSQLEVFRTVGHTHFRATTTRTNYDILFDLQQLRKFHIPNLHNLLWLGVCPQVTSIVNSNNWNLDTTAPCPLVKEVLHSSGDSAVAHTLRVIFPSLERLSISNCLTHPEYFFQRISAKTRGFPHLKSLRMSQCKEIPLQILDNIAFHCPLLEELLFDKCQFLCYSVQATFEAAVLRMVAELPRLRVLQVTMNHSEEFLTKLQEVAPRLDFFIVLNCTGGPVEDLRYRVIR